MNKCNSENPALATRENGSIEKTLAQYIQSELANIPGRTHPIEFKGQRYWVKKPENLGLRMRLQKGNTHRSFENERKALQYLDELALPIASIVAEGTDWFAIEDSGIPLYHLLKEPTPNVVENIKAYQAAGHSLAQLHSAGVCHGRPSVRDILWDGRKATFIDFERFSPNRNSSWFMVLDIIVLVICIFAISPEVSDELEAIILAYRKNGGEKYWQQAKKASRYLLWCSFLLYPISLRKTGRAKDVRAIVPSLRYIITRSDSLA